MDCIFWPKRLFFGLYFFRLYNLCTLPVSDTPIQDSLQSRYFRESSDGTKLIFKTDSQVRLNRLKRILFLSSLLIFLIKF
jgi:hypothetical protein